MTEIEAMALLEGTTPGPWEAAGRGDYSDFEGNSRVILGDDMRIAVVQHHGSDENDANCRLIVAAPTLAATVEAQAQTNAALRSAAERGLEYAIDAANDCKRKDEVFDNIMADIARIEAALAQQENG